MLHIAASGPEFLVWKSWIMNKQCPPKNLVFRHKNHKSHCSLIQQAMIYIKSKKLEGHWSQGHVLLAVMCYKASASAQSAVCHCALYQWMSGCEPSSRFMQSQSESQLNHTTWKQNYTATMQKAFLALNVWRGGKRRASACWISLQGISRPAEVSLNSISGESWSSLYTLRDVFIWSYSLSVNQYPIKTYTISALREFVHLFHMHISACFLIHPLQIIQTSELPMCGRWDKWWDKPVHGFTVFF